LASRALISAGEMNEGVSNAGGGVIDRHQHFFLNLFSWGWDRALIITLKGWTL
jgi:hypothetical protein